MKKNKEKKRFFGIRFALVSELTPEELKSNCLLIFKNPLRFNRIAKKLGIEEIFIGQDNHPGFFLDIPIPKEFEKYKYMQFRLNYPAQDFLKDFQDGYKIKKLIPTYSRFKFN